MKKLILMLLIFGTLSTINTSSTINDNFDANQLASSPFFEKIDNAESGYQLNTIINEVPNQNKYIQHTLYNDIINRASQLYNQSPSEGEVNLLVNIWRKAKKGLRGTDPSLPNYEEGIDDQTIENSPFDRYLETIPTYEQSQTNHDNSTTLSKRYQPNQDNQPKNSFETIQKHFNNYIIEPINKLIRQFAKLAAQFETKNNIIASNEINTQELNLEKLQKILETKFEANKDVSLEGKKLIISNYLEIADKLYQDNKLSLQEKYNAIKLINSAKNNLLDTEVEDISDKFGKETLSKSNQLSQLVSTTQKDLEDKPPAYQEPTDAPPAYSQPLDTMFESPSSQTELLQSERQLPGSRTNTETTTRSSSSSQNQEKPKTINDHINDYIINPIKNIITQLKNLMNYFKGTAKYTPIKKEEITFENLEQTIKDNLASAKKLPASEKINVANDYYDLALKIKNDQSLTEQQKETSKKIISKAIGQLRKSINNTKLLREIQLTANKISMIKMSDDKPSSSNSSPGDKYDNSDPDNYLLREHEQTDGGRHGSSTNSGDYDDPDYESFA